MIINTIEKWDPNPTIKIKIIKCSKPSVKQDPRWYKNHIGEIFEVKFFSYYVPLYDIPQYVLPDNRTIAMQDVEEVKEIKMRVVEKKNNREYPCLKISEAGLIVLFTAKDEGVVLKTNGLGYTDGEYRCFTENSFTLYVGTLELSNGD